MENKLAKQKRWHENGGDLLKIAGGEVESGTQYSKESSSGYKFRNAYFVGQEWFLGH